ncbi:hypothetical protein EJ02DRAFT_493750, partial [Clathrospora elynae]
AEFFRRALNGNWKEAEPRILELPEDEPDVFAHYPHGIYIGKLATMQQDDGELLTGPWEETLHILNAEYNALFRVYILAEKLQDLSIKNATLGAVFDVTKL